MPALRYITVSGAAFLTAAVACWITTDLVATDTASAESVASVASVEPAVDLPSMSKRNVRVIDMSAASAVRSDETTWSSRARMPPPPKHAPPQVETRSAQAAEKPKKKVARRSAPPKRDEAHAAYASAPTQQQRGGFGFFNW